jgi:F420-dependent oxidoreductase-like protein
MVETLRLGLSIGAAGTDGSRLTELAKRAESLGYSSLWSGEAYGADAVTPLAWAAASTSTIRLGTGIMQMPGRTPAMSAMTALALAELSEGRFLLGLGLSGPRVAEGWHGVPIDGPLRRTREYVDVVRQVVAGDTRVSLAGEHYQLPYRGVGATGLGVALRPMLNTRHAIPVYLAAIGPKNVRLAVEIADGVLPFLWSPTRWSDAYGAGLLDGAVDAFDVAPRVWVAMGDDLAACRDDVREHIAFYIGAMGPIGKNFYADLISRYGYEQAVAKVAACYAERRPSEAAAWIPDELVDELGLVGPPGHVAEQLDAWRRSPVTTIIVDTDDLTTLETLAELVL